MGMREDGANMHDIQSVLGHASVTRTEKHDVHFLPEHSAKKILKMLEGGKAETKRKHRERCSTNIKAVM